MAWPGHRPSQARALSRGDKAYRPPPPRHCQMGKVLVLVSRIVHAAPLVAEIGQGGTNPLTGGTTGPPRW